MSKNSNKKQAAEAKASAASKQEETKAKQESSEEWLEKELEDVDIPSDANSQKGNKKDADTLMKEAAERIETLQGDVREWKDNYMRLHAEWDTYRRRTNEQREQDKATATEGLVTDVLPVLDDFERTINFAKENGEEGLLSGVEAVYSKLVDVLKKSGVEVLNPVNDEAFDALEHQAVATVENADVPDETVASVMQKGYKMGKKVIRPAMVSVAYGGEPRPKAEEE